MIWQIVLYLGIALWCSAHLFKRFAPERRAEIEKRLGRAGRGTVAILILVSVVLMLIGYRGLDAVFVYEPPDWGRHANNLLMVFAVFLFGLGSSKSRLRGRLRHPMLTGFLLWTIAHLLVRGDSASIALFGILGVWAIVEMLTINKAEPNPVRFKGGTLAGDIRLLVISTVVFAVISVVHILLGPNPFLG